MSLLPGRLRFGAVSRVQEAWRNGELPTQTTPEETIRVLLADAGSRASPVAVVAMARRALSRAARAGVLAVPFTAPTYPNLLARLNDAPAVLWVRGRPDVLGGGSGTVAVVGSRAASPSSLQAGRRLAEDLAAAGIVVVSGLARGVDAAAHEGALATGFTVAVLGSGVDVVYPPEHAALAERIVASGAVVSEFAPGTAPLRHHFPLRNRIISGLCLAVVIVEAAERSGALITARTALDQGRDVMAMPGPVAGGRNRGAHGLIRDGALLVETASDVLSAVGSALASVREGARPAPSDPLLQALEPGDVMELDVLARRTGLPGSAVVARASQLEIEGRVRRVPGGRIQRLS
jgi:DNA processing protein